ncbi:MAG: methylenetetrahydrofolate reductase [NAD(P)H] [Burkholderiales bacterium]|nr:MAG: methylenetetrahydrofolate reductase [NAD(P)H] [Burkholderiales bacterium]
MTPSTVPVSFEFFPPNTPEGLTKLRETRRLLAQLEPEFFSVTFGAGGSTRDKSLGVVDEIATEGHAVAPHLSCVGATRDGIAELLEHWRGRGVRRLVALRGDLPSGMVDAGEFRYASDLVAFVRERTGDWFRIEVAAYPEVHPQAASADADLEAFVHKVRAGADAAITQYFFNADAYFSFVEAARARGVTVPIVPGIMPIMNYTQLARFSDACGAEIPRWIRMRLSGFGDDVESLRAFGHDVVTALCARLLEGGAPGLHFYTLNQPGPSRAIWQALAR